MPEAIDLNIPRLRRSKRIMELNGGQSPMPAEGMKNVSKLIEESLLGLELESPERVDGLTKQIIYFSLDVRAKTT